jgi:Domain of unknown function (DUF4062)
LKIVDKNYAELGGSGDLMSGQRKIRLMVSSSVLGNEEILRKAYTILSGYGYEVWMSYRGTIPISSRKTAFELCLDAVENCDVFFGIITGRYGSGRDKDDHSITHQEISKSIALDKPRFFVAHTNVTIARELFRKLRTDEEGKLRPPEFFNLRGNKIIDDIRILDMYDEATRADIELNQRHGNWVQPYTTPDEFNEFLVNQFSDQERIREIIEADDNEAK